MKVSTFVSRRAHREPSAFCTAYPPTAPCLLPPCSMVRQTCSEVSPAKLSLGQNTGSWTSSVTASTMGVEATTPRTVCHLHRVGLPSFPAASHHGGRKDSDRRLGSFSTKTVFWSVTAWSLETWSYPHGDSLHYPCPGESQQLYWSRKVDSKLRGQQGWVSKSALPKTSWVKP